MSITIYHNSRCSKSRQTLALIEKAGIQPKVIDYISKPLNKKEISSILKMLNIEALELIRKKEAIIKEEGINISTNAEALDAMVLYPKIIERPIVVKNNSKAILGRPPENVLELLQ